MNIAIIIYKVGLEERKRQCILLSCVSGVSPETISRTVTSV